MKRKHMILGCVAAALIASATIAPAMAYFTDHTEAAGNIQISLGDNTKIDEKADEAKKEIVISNTGQPVYVRVQVIAARESKPAAAGENWTDLMGDYYYYTKPVTEQNPTSTLTVQVREYLAKYQSNEKDDVKNIIVVYESTPVLYDESGNALPYNDSAISWGANVEVLK